MNTWLIVSTRERRAIISIMIIIMTFSHEGHGSLTAGPNYSQLNPQIEIMDFLIFQVRLPKLERSSSIYRWLEDCK